MRESREVTCPRSHSRLGAALRPTWCGACALYQASGPFCLSLLRVPWVKIRFLLLQVASQVSQRVTLPGHKAGFCVSSPDSEFYGLSESSTIARFLLTIFLKLFMILWCIVFEMSVPIAFCLKFVLSLRTFLSLIVY